MCGSNTKITKFDLFNLSQTVINIAILVTRVLLLVTPPVTRVIFYFFFIFGGEGLGEGWVGGVVSMLIHVLLSKSRTRAFLF